MDMLSIKILHIAPTDSYGKIPVWLSNQLNSLAESEFIPKVVGFRGSSISLVKPFSSLKQISKILWVVFSSRETIIHAHWGSLLGFLTAIANVKRKPLILTLRGSDVNHVLSESKMKYKLKFFLTKVAVSQAHFVIYVSKNLYEKIPKKSNDSAIIPDGTPTEIFFQTSQSSAQSKLGWSSDSKYIVFHSGRRPIEKNLALAQDTIRILNKQIDNLNFIVIQNDQDQSQLADIFRAADILLFTSTSEGSPNVVREAIACGCPVVSVDVGDVKQWINLCSVGKICEADPVHLSTAILEIFEKRSRVDSSIVHFFSLQKSLESLLNVYRNQLRNF